MHEATPLLLVFEVFSKAAITLKENDLQAHERTLTRQPSPPTASRNIA